MEGDAADAGPLGHTGSVARSQPPDFPFRPKSTAYLRPGMFWGVPLSDGRTACGRVLQIQAGSRVTFLAGLMDWVGDDPPSARSVAGARLIAQGTAHIKTITENGGEILGERALALDRIEPLPMLSHALPPGVRLVAGFDDLRAATSEEIETLAPLPGWGYSVIAISAEQYFVEGDRDPWWLYGRQAPSWKATIAALGVSRPD